MKGGLKIILYDRIKKSPLYLDEIYEICDSNGYKHDNASRRLRELVDTGLVERILGKNAIIGYRYIGSAPLSFNDQAIEQLNYQNIQTKLL